MIGPIDQEEILENPEIEPHTDAHLHVVKEHLTTVGMSPSVNGVDTARWPLGKSEVKPVSPAASEETAGRSEI